MKGPCLLLLLIGYPLIFSIGSANLCSMAPANAAEIRASLNGIEFKEECDCLIQLAEKAFPAYEAILLDKDAKPRQVARIFGVLTTPSSLSKDTMEGKGGHLLP